MIEFYASLNFIALSQKAPKKAVGGMNIAFQQLIIYPFNIVTSITF